MSVGLSVYMSVGVYDCVCRVESAVELRRFSHVATCDPDGNLTNV